MAWGDSEEEGKERAKSGNGISLEKIQNEIILQVLTVCYIGQGVIKKEKRKKGLYFSFL